MKLPELYRVRQAFDSASIGDVGAAVDRELDALGLQDRITPGRRVAVAVGSRGIDQLPLIVANVVDWLKSEGLKPFILPAMGSHGNATALGQTRILSELGITEKSVKAPIVSTLKVASLGKIISGAEVFCSRDALAAGHIVLINRVKPHTAFRGDVESGLCKMLAVGLGKERGAAEMHRFGLGASIVPAAQCMVDQAPILCGIAVVENAWDRIHTLRALVPEDFVDGDNKLLKLAWKLFPKLPVQTLDILVVDEMGKNISGAGMDPNVIGAWRREGGIRQPDYHTLIVLDLTPESCGNAVGIGMADLTTARLLSKIDMEATHTNARVSGIFRGVRLPMALDSDLDAIETAIGHVAHPKKLRMVRIRNTRELHSFWASDAVASQIRGYTDSTVDLKSEPMKFSSLGRLLPMQDGGGL